MQNHQQEKAQPQQQPDAPDENIEQNSAAPQEPPAPEPEPEPEPAPAPDELQALRDELAAAKDRMFRALADAENTRKLAARERDDARKYALSGFARDLLDVADNFHRAIEAIPPDLLESDARIKNIVVGIETVEKEMLKTFGKHGIQKIEPMDEIFDPNFHEVMFEAPVPGKPAGTIIQLVEPGYVINDRLLRPARVGVAKADPNAESGQPPKSPRLDTEA